MRNVTWVIDFGRRGSSLAARSSAGESLTALEAAEGRRRLSRRMFAATLALLAEARAVLAASPTSASASLGARESRVGAGGGRMAGLTLAD